MDGKVIIFSLIENLHLGKNTTFNLHDWTITNDIELISNKMPNINFVMYHCGQIYGDSLFQRTVAWQIHSLHNCPDITVFVHEESARLNFLLSLIWLEKDNSLFSTLQITQGYENYNVFLNIRDNFVSDSSGNYGIVSYQDDFLKQIEKIDFKNLIDLLNSDEDPKAIKSSENADILSYMNRADLEKGMSKQTRIQRSYLILTIARTTSFLPMKIAFYINVLECILLSDNTEINFKLQFYTAIFIGVNSEEKTTIRKLINTTYDVRSKFFHGSIIKQNQQELIDLSVQLDDIVRRTFIKAIEKKDIFTNKDNSILDNYLKSLMFT